MSIKHVNLISIPVTNQEESMNFYVNKLGFKVIADTQFDSNKRWIQLAPNKDAQTTISLVTWFENMKPGSLQGLVLSTNDIEETYNCLKQKGVEVSSIDNTPWGKFIYFHDPDGNGWMVQEVNNQEIKEN